MGEKEQLYKIIQNDVARRTASERRQSIILHRKLLKPNKQDRRSVEDRRRGKEKRIKSVVAFLVFKRLNYFKMNGMI